jgi:hypothetical protein
MSKLRLRHLEDKPRSGFGTPRFSNVRRQVQRLSASLLVLSVGSSALVPTSFAETLTAASASAGAAASAPRPDPDKPLRDVLQGEAKDAYDQANALLAKNELAGAFTLYHRAYELSHDPRLFWNMGRVEYLRDRNAAARTWVERYFSERKVAYTDVEATTESGIREMLRSTTSEIVVSGLPSGTKLFLDGHEAATAPLNGPLFVEPGLRALRIELPNRRFVTREEALKAGGQWKLDAGPLLEKLGAVLSITTGEPKSSIRIDQRVVANGNWRGVLVPGEHDVEVLLPGKQTFHERVTLLSGSSKTLSAVLKDEDSALVWPWIVGGTLAAGLAVGAVLLLKHSPSETTRSQPAGGLGAGGNN